MKDIILKLSTNPNQYSLPLFDSLLEDSITNDGIEQKLNLLLKEDLNFHKSNLSYLHNFHSFPAKFPPQLPEKFITALTKPGDCILDPMMGSGTTIVESARLGRIGIGFDIDPLAIRISKIKTTNIDINKLIKTFEDIDLQYHEKIKKNLDDDNLVEEIWDDKTQKFIEYWYDRRIRNELSILIKCIQTIEILDIRKFFEVIFSGIIITKTGGVSLALDLAHTRPHKAKIILQQDEKNTDVPNHKKKTLRSVWDEFEKRVRNYIKSVKSVPISLTQSYICNGNAQNLPLQANVVSLIVTSPPYASNAIDYMRAHKFSLVWLGHTIPELEMKRKEYIGGESNIFNYEILPQLPTQIVGALKIIDGKKSYALLRYYSEMTRALREMYRVLKPNGIAIIVVGNSVLRGVDTKTAECLADIGKMVGFNLSGIGIRQLDRNRRMMPAGNIVNLSSQIQQRMHEEYVIGLYKPI